MPDLEIERIGLEELPSEGNILQTAFWGRLKSEFGWIPHAFSIGGLQGGPSGNARTALLVLVRAFGGGNSMAYVPHGPMMICGSPDQCWTLTSEIALKLKPMLPKSCVFIRFDPPWNIAGKPASGGLYGFHRAEMDIQPPSTVILDITKPEEELLAGMKSKTRYNIRLAEKKGVVVNTSGIEKLPLWYELSRITAERDRISLRSYDYYERFFQLAEESADENGPELRLLLAEIEGTAEAGIIICFQGAAGHRIATYLYGASSNNKRNYMPSYALQWEAIRQSSSAGCVNYDFFGIPPAEDPAHPMHGLYRFKTGFGGDIIHRPGCYDYPYRKLVYAGYRRAEWLRNYYHKKLKKRL